MPTKSKFKWKELITENFSYKVVALFIALILWLTILGRRDFTLSKTLEVELMPSNNQVVVSQSVDSIKVKVSGPRTALKKFMDSGLSQLVTLDISKKGVGDIEVDVPANKIDVPFGVKVVSVRPNTIRAKVSKKE